MSQGNVVMTGFARHSLGEAFVRSFLNKRTGAHVIGIDKIRNTALPECRDFQQVEFDLNPLNCKDGLGAFALRFAERLSEAVTATGTQGIEFLVQCAGVYEFGKFLEHTAERRSEVLGVNVLGVTEVLHGVMALNRRLCHDNEKEFTHILVGSYQGLYARSGRPIYAPSKAYGVDLCTSLVGGGELAKCIYLAPGPIDTPMLHRNHWVTRAEGPETFFNEAFNGPLETYESIFVYCDDSSLEKFARKNFEPELENLRLAMGRYKDVRSEAFKEDLGVLSKASCAGVLTDMLTGHEMVSGVYSLTAEGMGRELAVKRTTFDSLNRRLPFESVATTIPWN
jgi:NAD(P)-dependent dehydrogenase (short-subunit alcohol dehydrogenase family)